MTARRGKAAGNAWVPALSLLLAGCHGPNPSKVSPMSMCLPDGRSPMVAGGQVPVTSIYDGFGCNSLASDGSGIVLHLRPKASVGRSETHASLMLAATSGNPMVLECAVKTLAQLRSGAEPKPHEVGWLVWNYQDDKHFYYFIPKPNGWELGKRDPAYPGGQRFLKTGDDPDFPVGNEAKVRIVQRDTRIEVYLDSTLLTSYVDIQRPYLTGRAGVYCEDADAIFSGFSVG